MSKKEYMKIAEKAILKYANVDKWDDLSTDSWDAVDVQKIIVEVIANERMAYQCSKIL